MKEYWLCRIFGHKFIGSFELEGGNVAHRPIPGCVRCGLTKEEIRVLKK